MSLFWVLFTFSPPLYAALLVVWVRDLSGPFSILREKSAVTPLAYAAYQERVIDIREITRHASRAS